jgi:acyl carrier protein
MTDSEVTDALVQQIVAIWQRVAPNCVVEPDTDLFDLPVTSLEAVRIRSWIRAELGREIELYDFVDHPTLQELAAVVAAAPVWEGERLSQDGLADLDEEADDAAPRR